MPNRSIIFKIPLTVAIVSMALLFVALLGQWMGLPGMNSEMFCETFRPGLIKQPVNAWSNLAFVLAGLGIGWLQSRGHKKGHRNPFTQTRFYPTFFATVVVLLGPGSMAMHASTSSISGFFDMLSMYMVASFMFSYALERLLHWKPTTFLICFVIALTLCIIIDRGKVDFSIGMFPAMILIFGLYIVVAGTTELYLVFIRKTGADARMALAFVGAFALAFIIWLYSLTGEVLCDPDSLLQGHAVWHVLNAVSLFYLYRYYVSEGQA